MLFFKKKQCFIHFLSVVSQISTLCHKSYSSSSCDFSCVVLPLSSSFSSCSFLISTLIFYSSSTLLFLQISTLCLCPFRCLSPYVIPLVTLPSLSPLQLICSSNCSPPKLNSPYSYSQLPWYEIIHLPYLLSLLLQLPPPQTLVYLSMLQDLQILLQMIPIPTPFFSLVQIQMGIFLQILVYQVVSLVLLV